MSGYHEQLKREARERRRKAKKAAKKPFSYVGKTIRFYSFGSHHTGVCLRDWPGELVIRKKAGHVYQFHKKHCHDIKIKKVAT